MTSNTHTQSSTEYSRLFIGGLWVEPATSAVIEVFSPATGEKIGQVPLASSADVDAACAAARAAFDVGPWPKLRPSERQAILAKAASLVEERADEFKALLTKECGQPAMIIDLLQFGSGLAALQYY